MKVVHGLAHVLHNPRWEFTRGRRIFSKDLPSRATIIREALDSSDIGVEFIDPSPYPLTHIKETHAYWNFIQKTAQTLAHDEIIYPDVFPVRRKVRRPDYDAALAGYYCYDTGTPLSRNTFDAAKASVDIALTAADLVRQEGVVYALCRPPGHHAERDVFGGYCYFNNPAIAAKHLEKHGKVAILDIDFHHGNGTQDIFYDCGQVLTVSIHGDPAKCYPYFSGFADERGEGAGEGANLNIPLSPGSSPSSYFDALDQALQAIVDFRPDSLIVAVGFDTCKGDPAGSFDLQTRHYPVIAARIASIGFPLLLVQEGGYRTSTLGRNAVAFLRAIQKGVRS